MSISGQISWNISEENGVIRILAQQLPDGERSEIVTDRAGAAQLIVWLTEVVNHHGEYPLLKLSHMYLNGMTCIKCGQGWYNGYASNGLEVAVLTTPCDKCGHQAPAMMTITDLHAAIRERDAILYGKGK